MGSRFDKCGFRSAAFFTRLSLAGLPCVFFGWSVFRRHYGSIPEHSAGNGMAFGFKLADGVEWICDVRNKPIKIIAEKNMGETFKEFMQADFVKIMTNKRGILSGQQSPI